MIEEMTADVLVAANDHGSERIAFAMPLDLPAAVVVHAQAPRGSGCFAFAAGPMPTLVSNTLRSTDSIH